MAAAEAEIREPSTASLLPLLVFHHQPQSRSQDEEEEDDEMLMFSLTHHSVHERMEDGLLAGGKSVCWTTPQGWMLVSEEHDTSSPACLWNPRTGDRLPLPNVGEEHEIPQHCKCILTHKDPTRSSSCVVALFHREEPDMWCCRVGGGGWQRYTYDIGDYGLPEEYREVTPKVMSSVAAVEGKLYFVASKDEMGVIDFADDSLDDILEPHFEYFHVAMPDFPRQDMCSAGVNWLLESQDELFLVRICFVGFDASNIGAIRVYKMVDEQWRTVRDVGDSVLLLDNSNMAASCAATPLGLKPNRIYFMNNFREDDARLCIFNLQKDAREDVIQVHQHEGMQLFRKPFWIVPPLALLDTS